MADINSSAPNTIQDYLARRLSEAKKERQSFISHYKEISENIQPRRGRFDTTSDRNKGDRRHNLIINSKGSQALRTATSGVFSGIMSPSRPWFNLGTPDPSMMEFRPVKVWLNQVELLIRAIFNASNLYNMAPVMLGETMLFGTGCMLHVDDFEDVARFYTQTAGSYMISQNDRYEVDTVIREWEMTVSQIVGKFGLENVSESVKDQWDKSNYDAWYPVCHVIEPNPESKSKPLFSVDKAFRSVYFQPDTAKREKLLRQSGFDEFPAYVPRWGTAGEDVYGTDCPGMIALGDVKSLQIEEKRKAQAIDKMVNPPLKGPASLRNVPVYSIPGGLTIHDGSSDRETLAPLYQVNPQIQELSFDIQKVEQRIEEAFHVDLFRAISNMEGIQPKNQLELSQRNEERLQELGPVLEQFHGEFLDKLVDRTFNQVANAEILPPPPPELEGQELKINYISSLAQAQRAVATGGIERLTNFVGGMAQMNPAVLDKLDMDQAIDEFSTAIMAPPKLVVGDVEVAKKRQADAEAAARQQQMEQMSQMADAGSKVANIMPDEMKNQLGDSLADATGN
jgi:hypothetical protein